MSERILVTSDAGFVGPPNALALKRSDLSSSIVILDNLRRRDSDLIFLSSSRVYSYRAFACAAAARQNDAW